MVVAGRRPSAMSSNGPDDTIVQHGPHDTIVQQQATTVTSGALSNIGALALPEVAESERYEFVRVLGQGGMGEVRLCVEDATRTRTLAKVDVLLSTLRGHAL